MSTPSAKQIWIEAGLVAALLASAVAFRWWTVETGRDGFDSDEAVAAIQAKDVWLGRDYPVFFAGQCFNGTLESYLTALFYAARGNADVDAVRQFGVSIVAAGFLFFYLFVRWAAGPGAALLTLAMLAFNTGFFVIWSIKLRGGYLVLPVAATAILWSGLALDERLAAGRQKDGDWTDRTDRTDKKALTLAGTLGFALGLGWWNHRSVIFAIGGLGLALCWRYAALILQGAERRALGRLALTAVALAVFALSLDRPFPVPSDVAPLAPGWLLGIVRISPVLLSASLLVAIGERNAWRLKRDAARAEDAAHSAGRGAWAAGTCGCLLGYSPVLWFMARGGTPQTSFFFVPLRHVWDNIVTIAIKMFPWFLGLSDVVETRLPIPISLGVAATALIVIGVGGAFRRAWQARGSRLARFVILMALSSVVTLTAQIAYRDTIVNNGDPRHVLLIAYALAALCGIGWLNLAGKREWLAIAAVALFAFYGLSSAFALPGRDQDERRVPPADAELIRFLTGKRVHACFFMDYAPGRGYSEAWRLTFLSGECVLFVPPQMMNRFPEQAEIARLQKPAVWVSRRPPAFLTGRFANVFKRPLMVYEMGDYVIAFSDESEAVYESAYLLRGEPPTDPNKARFAGVEK